MPVNPEVLRDLIRRFGAAAVKAAKEKVMVPNMTGTATAASTSLGSIPKVESTVGKEAAVAAAAMSAPFVVPEAVAQAPLWGDLGKDIALSTPAFLAIDQAPTIVGQKPMSEAASDIAENVVRGVLPDGENTEKVVANARAAAPFIVGVPQGAASGLVTKLGISGVGALENGLIKAYPKVADFIDDLTWNDFRRQAWNAERAARMDERGFLRSMINGKTQYGDKIEHPWLVQRYMEVTAPDAFRASQRRAIAKRNKKFMERVDVGDVPEFAMRRLENGEVTVSKALANGWIKPRREGSLGVRKPEYLNNTDWGEFDELAHEMPKYSELDVPSNIDLSGMVDMLKGAQRTRDFVYESMVNNWKSRTSPQIPMIEDAVFGGMQPTFKGANTITRTPLVFRAGNLSTSSHFYDPNTGAEQLKIGLWDAMDRNNPFVMSSGKLGSWMDLSEVVGHEMAHSNPVFNARYSRVHPYKRVFMGGPDMTKMPDSPYYNNVYKWVPDEYKALFSKTKDGVGFENLHDSEFAENYADAWGIRAALNHYGINDGTRPYTINDLVKLQNEHAPKSVLDNIVKKDEYGLSPIFGYRYLQYHGPEPTIEALNNAKAKGGFLEDYSGGGPIHIKPENRGKFTALLKRTGKTASWYKAHGTPAQKKMAVFSLNARKWKHEDGGFLRNYFDDGGSQTMLAAPGTYLWGSAISNAVSNVVNTIRGEKAYSDAVPQMLPGAAKSSDAEALQGILKNSGYDIGTAEPDGYFGKKSTMALQSMLVDAGYDIGSTGSNKNGIDGIIGNKTIAAYNDWVANGARIKKAKKPVGVLKEDAVPVSPADIASVYTPINSNTIETKPYEGIYNYGQYYDKKFGNYVTDTGLDLSNISTEGVGENKHTDTFSPFVFDNLSQCKKESARNTLECASHITYLNLDDKRGFNIDRNGLRGSAWTMGDNMVKAGGARLFDIFADAGAPSGKWDDSYKQRTIDFVRSKAKGEEYENYLMENLQPGDVVELLYPNSRNFKTAYDESKGKHQNTHIGYVVSVGGELYIRDNVGNHTTGVQTVHTRKLSSVVSGKERDGVLITGAVRAKDALGKNGGYDITGRQGRDMSAIGISPTDNDDASQSRLSNDAAYRAMSAVYNNKNKLLSDNSLSVDEFNRIAGLTQAIMLKESASGELFNNQKWISKNSTLPSIINDANRSELDRARAFGYGVGNPIAYTVSDLTGGALSSINAHAEPSSGLGSVKYQGPESLLTDRQRRQLGDRSMIKDALRSAQPETSGVTTFYALCTAVSNIKKILNRYAPRDIAEDPDIIDQLAALSYNQGLDKITETLQNAKADGDWDGHLKGLLEATYGKNAMILRGYNNTNMFSDEESKKIEEERRNKMNDLRARLQKAGIKADAIANMIAQRESTKANTPIASSGKLR